MPPEQWKDEIAKFNPVPGPGYAHAGARQDELLRRTKQIEEGLAKEAKPGEAEALKAFQQRERNKTAEALTNPSLGNHIARQEFIDNFGPAKGESEYHKYELAIRYGKAAEAMRGEDVQQRELRIARDWTPAEGAPDYADVQAYREHLFTLHQGIETAKEKAAEQARKLVAERDKDPAAYAIKHMPAAADAWQKLQTSLAGTDLPAMQNAARNYVLVTTQEQQSVGVPPDRVRLLPEANLKILQGEVEKPERAGGPSKLYDRVRAQAMIWGDNWGRIAGELGKGAEPAVRVMSHPIDPTAGQVLAELASTPFATIAKDQDKEKQAAIKAEVLKAFKPLFASMDGKEGAQRAFDDFRSQAEKYAAWHVAHHNSTAAEAAKAAWGALVDHGYSFTGTLRVPRDAGVTPADASIAATDILRDLADVKPEPALQIPGVSAGYAKQQTLKQVVRDGAWLTLPRNDGIVLMYRDRPVEREDGSLISYTWRELAQRAVFARRRMAEEAAKAHAGARRLEGTHLSP
jgi:hypothetical protein